MMGPWPPRPCSTWRSTALEQGLRTTPFNQREEGGLRSSSTLSQRLNQEMPSAASAQNPCGSESERAYMASKVAADVLVISTIPSFFPIRFQQLNRVQFETQ